MERPVSVEERPTWWATTYELSRRIGWGFILGAKLQIGTAANGLPS
jgi:hypothetical protein